MSQQWHTDTIAFNSRKPNDREINVHREPDWTIVDTIVFSFPALTRMVVGLDSREDMVRFEQEVAMVHMPRLSGSGMLKYALWDPPGFDLIGYGTWLRASPGSDDTEGVSLCSSQYLVTEWFWYSFWVPGKRTIQCLQ